MTIIVHTGVVIGVQGQPVQVESDLRPGIPYFDLVGLAGSAIKEARTRVEQAVRSSAMEWPRKRITLNLAPAELRKEGSGLDLALAIACLADTRGLDLGRLARSVYLGELSLDGQVRPARGVLPVVEAAKRRGIDCAVVPTANAYEAGLVPGVTVVPVRSLADAIAWAERGERDDNAVAIAPDEAIDNAPDWSALRGQEVAKRAAEIALTGGHNLLLFGPPGTGKTLLARCLPGLLPVLEGEELIDVLRVRSAIGDHLDAGTDRRPFRAPHHSVSTAGLIGGGRPLSPGEITVAHGGVLFLDELAEFSRSALESLRQPLEDGHLTITRAGCRVTFPARVLLVAASNPCPCGYLGSSVRGCCCPPATVQRYQARLSGPILDRIDLSVCVDRPAAREVLAAVPSARETSPEVRARITAARRRSINRQGCLNAHLRADKLHNCAPEAAALKLLERASDRLGLSPRITTRMLKVGRSIADLEGSGSVRAEHIGEAFALRLTSSEDAAA